MDNLYLKEKVKHGFEGLNFATYNYVKLNYEIDIHWHSEYEIVYVRKGSVTFCVNGEMKTISAKEALIIDPYSTHYTKYSKNSNCDFTCYVFGEKFLFPSKSSYIYTNIFSKINLRNVNLTQHIKADKSYKSAILETLESLALHNENYDKNALSIQIDFLKIFNLLISNEAYFISSNKTIETNDHIITALQAIQENYLNNYKISDLATQLNFSSDYFTNLFKKNVGVTPKQYIINLRIEKAKELLSLTKGTPISEVAYGVGFNDISYFCRIFKKNTGKTPKEFQSYISM